MAVAAMLYSVVVLALCLLVSMALTAGYYYGPVELVAGPGCSRLVRASPFLVQSITVKMAEGERASGENGLVLYGLAGGPPRLDVPAAWSEARRVVVPANSHREWVYFLNRGSELQVNYNDKPETGLINHLCIVIAQGQESFMQWSEKPLVHDSTLSWRLVHGAGTVKQTIDSSQGYYVAVGNLNGEEKTVTLELDIRVRAVLYDTTGADYACSPGSSGCTYRLPILGRNVAVLSSAVKERSNSDDDEQSVKVVLSYEPRWIVYFVASAILAVALLLLYEVLTAMLGFYCCCCTGAGGGRRAPGAADHWTTTTSRLLAADKEEEASLGSSYDSVSHDGDEDDGGGDEEEGQRLCVVCCDAPRDCFFLPCGHSATCHPCGTRIVEGDGGSCPFCRRKLKRVRRIFAV